MLIGYIPHVTQDFNYFTKAPNSLSAVACQKEIRKAMNSEDSREKEGKKGKGENPLKLTLLSFT